MSCSSCQGCNNCYPCTTCGEPTPPPPPPDCPNPEECEEVINSKCVMYTGIDLPCLDITPSTSGPVRVNDIIIAINEAVCQAGLGVTYIETTVGSENCITLSGTGSQSDPIVIGLNLDPDGGITCGPDGLAADTGTNITLADHSGLVWTDPSNPSELDTLYDTTQTGNSVELLYNGGFVASQDASVWSQLTLVQVLDAILFPTRVPTYVQPTVSLTNFTPANPYEVGSTVSINFIPKARKNDAGGFNSIKVVKTTPTSSDVCTDTPTFTNASIANTPGYGVSLSYVPLLPNGTNGTAGTNDNFEYTADTCAISHTVLAPSGSSTTSTTSWIAQATHVLGPVKLNSNGAQTTTAIPAGTISSSAVSVTGIYPIFYGFINDSVAATISTVSANITAFNTSITKKKLDYANGNVRIDYCGDFNSNQTLDSKWFWIAIPNYNPAKTKVVTSWNSALPVPINSASAWRNLGSTSITPPGSSPWGGNYSYTIYMTAYPTITQSGYTELQN